MKKLVVLAVFALASCGPREAATENNPQPVPMAVAIDGFGAIKIGMTREEAERASGVTLQAAPADGGSDCQYARLPEGPTGLTFMLTGGVMARIDVSDGNIATEAGAHIGSSEAEIAQAYGGRVSVTSHKYEAGHHILTVTDPDHPNNRYVFETDGNSVTRYRSGRLPEVEFVEGCS